MFLQLVTKVKSGWCGRSFKPNDNDLAADVREMLENGGPDDGILYDWGEGTILVDYKSIGK